MPVKGVSPARGNAARRFSTAMRAKMGNQRRKRRDGLGDGGGADLRFAAGSCGVGLAWRLVGFLVAADRIEHLASMDRYYLWGFHPQTNLSAADLDDHDCNVIVDDNSLVLLAG